MSEPKVSEVLMLAKDKLIDGWSSDPYPGSDRICALIALSRAAMELQSRETPAGYILCEAAGISPGETTRWSDSGPKQKVIDGFDAAIRLAKEREQL